jgi:hypothetical protein
MQHVVLFYLMEKWYHRTPLIFLKEQLHNRSNNFDDIQHGKYTRIHNFLTVPFQLEKFIVLGYLVCLSCFLSNLIVVPLRIIIKLIPWYKSNMDNYRHSIKSDLSKFLLIGLSISIMLLIDSSRLYHSIRSQSTVKLYVIFNVCEVADKLLCSFGLDVLDSYFDSIDRYYLVSISWSLKTSFYFFISLLYIVLHTVILLYQTVTLNVAINSQNNALLALLISNQFVEIKSSVFKKTEQENLFQLACSEVVERFYISIFCSVIILQNTLEIIRNKGLEISYMFKYLVSPLMITFLSEVLVDWLKHSFITKFNGISPTIYSQFRDMIYSNYLTKTKHPHLTPFGHDIVSSKIGFSPYPVLCLLIYMIFQVIHGYHLSTLIIGLFLVPVILCFKVLLDIFLSHVIISRLDENIKAL